MAAERPRAWLCALLACLLVLRQDGVVLPCSLGLLCHAPLPAVEEVWCPLMAYTPRDSAEALVLWTLVRESEMGRVGSMRLRTLANLAVVVGSLYTTHSNTGALTWAGGCLAARLGGRSLHRWGSADVVGALPSASPSGARGFARWLRTGMFQHFLDVFRHLLLNAAAVRSAPGAPMARVHPGGQWAGPR